MENTVQQLSPLRRSIAVRELEPLQKHAHPLAFFDDRVIEFFQAYSQRIASNNTYGRLPEVLALSFWLRRTNLLRMLKENPQLTKNNVRTEPLGLVFHICPSNVDTMFLYSLALGLMTGNANVVRISEKLQDDVTSFLLNEMNSLLGDPINTPIAKHLSIVVYGHDDTINAELSRHADARMIWGGDATINAFSQYPTKQTTKDLVFRDRISCAIINAASFLSLTSQAQEETTRLFFNDAYAFDQKACSSPQTLFLLGQESDAHDFADIFSKLLTDSIDNRYRRDLLSIASLKLRHAAEEAFDGKIRAVLKKNARLFFVEPQGNPLEYHSCGAGYFYLKQISSITALSRFLNKSVQTITYASFDQHDKEELTNTAKAMVDRIVPFGKALDFDYLWDSYNLIEELTRKIVSL